MLSDRFYIEIYTPSLSKMEFEVGLIYLLNWKNVACKPAAVVFNATTAVRKCRGY